jgi:hypothetical protein
MVFLLACGVLSASEAAEPPPVAQMHVGSTNRATQAGVAPVRYRLVVDGPLAQPSMSLHKARQSGVRSSPAKAWLNLINPFAPVNPTAPVELSSVDVFNPTSMGKVQPRAFRDDRTHEPSALISFGLERVKP